MEAKTEKKTKTIDETETRISKILLIILSLSIILMVQTDSIVADELGSSQNSSLRSVAAISYKNTLSPDMLATERQITTSTKDQFSPAIYRNRIVYVDKRNGNWDIYMYDLSTNTERRITANKKDQSAPTIYGNNIVYQDARNGNLEIYMYDLSTKYREKNHNK